MSVDIWEKAYQDFETPEEEKQKFARRFKENGVQNWDRSARIGDLFCGRGNGLIVLEEWGFKKLTGVDISPNLLSDYNGKAVKIQADCRSIPLPDRSFDAIIIQGGLHHLPSVTEDFEIVLKEIRRLLVPCGTFLMIEPWLTPFLRVVHFAIGFNFVQRLVPKTAHLQTMIIHEADTYYSWLSKPDFIEQKVKQYFIPVSIKKTWGKFVLVAHPKPEF